MLTSQMLWNCKLIPSTVGRREENKEKNNKNVPQRLHKYKETSGRCMFAGAHWKSMFQPFAVFCVEGFAATLIAKKVGLNTNRMQLCTYSADLCLCVYFSFFIAATESTQHCSCEAHTTALDMTYTSSTKTPWLHRFSMLLITINQGVTLDEVPSSSDPAGYVSKVQLVGFHREAMSSEDHTQS